MAHFAEIDGNNIVIRVLVVDDAHEAGGADYLAYDLNLGGTWIKTSYNGSIRKNFAGVGFYYDAIIDAFIPPKPYSSWILDTTDFRWKAPIAHPGIPAVWDEMTLTWI